MKVGELLRWLRTEEAKSLRRALRSRAWCHDHRQWDCLICATAATVARNEEAALQAGGWDGKQAAT